MFESGTSVTRPPSCRARSSFPDDDGDSLSVIAGLGTASDTTKSSSFLPSMSSRTETGMVGWSNFPAMASLVLPVMARLLGFADLPISLASIMPMPQESYITPLNRVKDAEITASPCARRP